MKCPTCGTEVARQKIHCPIHDTMRDAGTECDNCVAEAQAAIDREKEADNALVDSGNSGSDSASVSGKKGKRGEHRND